MSLFGGPPNIEKLKEKRNVNGLIKALQYQKDSEIRKEAVNALGESDELHVVEALIGALSDEVSGVRQAAANTLAKIGDNRAVEPLISTLADQDAFVRSAAVKALGEIGDAQAVEPICNALTDTVYFVIDSALEALGKIGDARAVDPICTFLPEIISRSKKFECGVLQQVFEILGEIGDTRAVDLIVEKLESGEFDQESTTGQRVSDEAKRLAACKKNARLAAIEALGKIGDPHATNVLLAEIKDAIDRYQLEIGAKAIVAIGKIGDVRAVEPLMAIMEKYTAEMAGPAAETLGKIGDARAVESLIIILSSQDRFIGNQGVTVRINAAEALGQIGDPRAIEPLIDALHSKDKDLVQSAVNVLTNLYKSSTTPHEFKQHILNRSRSDVVHHSDDRRHSDYMSSDCHKDNMTHTDESTEFAFSLT